MDRENRGLAVKAIDIGQPHQGWRCDAEQAEAHLVVRPLSSHIASRLARALDSRRSPGFSSGPPGKNRQVSSATSGGEQFQQPARSIGSSSAMATDRFG